MEDITKHYVISGRVQGVGFRAYTQRCARELGVNGWVRNLHDGRVEVVAAGIKDIMVLFEAKLKSGPTHGQVESLIAESWKTFETLGFEVRKDGSEPCCEN